MDKHEMVKLLNKVWATIPYKNKPTYNEFNCFIPFDNNVPLLREIEKENDKIGIANYNSNFEGITTLSLIATITDLLADFRLAVIIEDVEDKDIIIGHRKIMGFSIYEKE